MLIPQKRKKCKKHNKNLEIKKNAKNNKTQNYKKCQKM